MLDTKHLEELKKNLHEYQLIRREVIKKSDDALMHAKRAIFSLHRGNNEEAKEKLSIVEKYYQELIEMSKKDPRVKEEGAYKAGIEEYVEANLFFQFVVTGKIGKIKEFKVSTESYLAGLCDVPGELYRYAIKAATERNIDLVKKCSEMASEIIGELIQFNLTSYLRTKFDQAKQAAQKLEQVVYEVSLRK